MANCGGLHTISLKDKRCDSCKQLCTYFSGSISQRTNGRTGGEKLGVGVVHRGCKLPFTLYKTPSKIMETTSLTFASYVFFFIIIYINIYYISPLEAYY